MTRAHGMTGSLDISVANIARSGVRPLPMPSHNLAQLFFKFVKRIEKIVQMTSIPDEVFSLATLQRRDHEPARDEI
jgi:hypothetical protein